MLPSGSPSHSACELNALGKADLGLQTAHACTESSCMHWGQHRIICFTLIASTFAVKSKKSFLSTAVFIQINITLANQFLSYLILYKDGLRIVSSTGVRFSEGRSIQADSNAGFWKRRGKRSRGQGISLRRDEDSAEDNWIRFFRRRESGLIMQSANSSASHSLWSSLAHVRGISRSIPSWNIWAECCSALQSHAGTLSSRHPHLPLRRKRLR